MKSIFLHGAIGEAFGREFKLNVSTPREALKALLAINEGMKKYLIEKEIKGIHYGIKKKNEFIQQGEEDFYLNSDFHITPIPAGGATFALNLAMMAATTALSMIVNKKMAETMKQDNETLTMQTQSYIYNGKSNHMKQGQVIPFGYGRLIVGSSVVSSSVINYAWDNDKGKIIFTGGPFGLLDKNHPYSNETLYPWLDFAKFRSESHMTQEEKTRVSFKNSDPVYSALKSHAQVLNVNNDIGIYQRSVGDSNKPYWLSKQGNTWTGYTIYKFNGPYGGDGKGFASLPNYNSSNGYWGGGLPANAANGYKMNQDEADQSVCAIIQSVPVLESQSGNREFYPIYFSGDDENKNAIPVTIGERYKNGSKENGLGWHAFESVSVQKNVDMICEGPIEGFCDNQGRTLEYKTQPSDTPERTINFAGKSINMREENNDFLQAVRLNDIPVKEIKNGLDSFNFNEFDIDIARNNQGEIGGYDQNMLEPQYRFISSTKDTQGQLFGYRITDVPQPEAAYSIKEFQANYPFVIGDYVKDPANPGSIWSVARNLNTEFKEGVNYKKGNSITYKIVYIKTGNNYQFYEVNEQYETMVKDIQSELKEGNNLWEGDIFSENEKFYEGKFDIKDVMRYDPELSFRIGDLLVTEGSDKLWEVEHESYFMLRPGEIKTIESIAKPSTLTIMEELKARDHVQDAVINPTSHPQFFDPIDIKSPEDIFYINKMPEKVKGIFVSAGNLNKTNFDPKEEYYLSHSIINPLVTDAVISLQIDELMYVYGGDNMEITYKFGTAMMAIVGALAAAGLASSVGTTDVSPKGLVMWGAVGGVVGALIAELLPSIDVGDKVENSGESWPNRTKFRIKYGNEGESFYTTDVYFYGVATSSYIKDIHISLPPNPLNKNRVIKVYRITPERNPVIEGEIAARYKERTSLGAITEITNINLNYNSSVVIGSRVVAKEIPSIPKRNYNLKLKKVQVPINYDPETRQYTDSWSGEFAEELKWTDNPAWCLYDLITNKRYGVGKFGIREQDVDKWTLYKMAKYCDEIVSTGYSSPYIKAPFKKAGRKIIIENMLRGDEQFNQEFQHPGKNIAIYFEHFNELRRIEAAGKDPVTGEYVVVLDREVTLDDGHCATEIYYPLLEPRYTINAMLTSQQDAFKLINEMASVFRAFAYWDSGAIHFFQDEPRESVMMFTNNNIEKSGFVYSNTPRTSRANSVKIKYLDKFNEFKPKVWHSEDKDKIDQNGFLEKTIDGFGIASSGQASRAAEYIVQGGNMETELISFRTNMAGAYLKPGDVFEVMDSKRTVGRFGGKIIDIYIENGGQRAEVDIDFPIRTIIDPEDKGTYKKLKLYTISTQETIESLNEYTEDVDGDGIADGVVNDSDISGLRQRQIGEFEVVSIKNGNTTLTIMAESQYEYIEGSFNWREAQEDASKRGGELATIGDKEELSFFKMSMPLDKEAWIGGMYVEEPEPSKFIWGEPQGCEDNEIKFFNFPDIKGFLPENERVVIGPNDQYLQVSSIAPLSALFPLLYDGEEVFDSDGNQIFYGNPDASPDGTLLYPNLENGSEVEYNLRDNYIYAKGSSVLENNGDWYRGLWTDKKGYMLKKKPSTELLDLNDIKGLTFILEDSVSFANAATYKVINVSEESLGIFKIDGMEYDKNKFKLIEENETIPTPRMPVIFTESLINAPDDVTLEYSSSEDLSYTNRAGRLVFPPPKLRASWSPVLGAAGYKVQFFKGKELMVTAELSNKVTRYDYKGRDVKAGEKYHVRVYSISV